MDLLQMTLESIAAISPETLLWCGRGAAIVVALLALVAALADLRHDFWSMHQAADERQETIGPAGTHRCTECRTERYRRAAHRDG